MPTNPQLVVFCLTVSLLLLTPGPNFIYVLTRGITQGRRPALLAVIGLGVGVLVHTTLASLGVSALVRSSYLAFQMIKYGGSFYLIYLGIKTLRNQDPITIDSSVAVTARTTQHQQILWQSLIASLTNPKTILFFLSFLPQFVNSATANVAPQLFLLGSIYMILTVIIYGVLAYFAGSIGQWLRTRAMFTRRLRWITGTSFIGLGLWAALPERR